MDKPVYLYTDGACKGNPGAGGQGVFMCYGTHERELFGGEAETTSNRVELTAVIEGLKSLKHRYQVIICTDLQYVKNGTESWIYGWKRNGWKAVAKKPVKDDGLWKELDSLVQQHDVRWMRVKGHAGHSENEKADESASQGMAKFVRHFIHDCTQTS